MFCFQHRPLKRSSFERTSIEHSLSKTTFDTKTGQTDRRVCSMFAKHIACMIQKSIICKAWDSLWDHYCWMYIFLNIILILDARGGSILSASAINEGISHSTALSPGDAWFTSSSLPVRSSYRGTSARRPCSPRSSGGSKSYVCYSMVPHTFCI